jgi:serine protease Do
MGRLLITLLLITSCAQSGAAVSDVRRTPVVNAVEKAVPSVVNIGTERVVQVQYKDPRSRLRGDLFDQLLREFMGPPSRPGYQVQSSLGSGVIIDRQGYILTNYHVIERATAIKVTLSDESVHYAQFLAGDELNDLALIKINAGRPLQAVEFAADDDTLLGETVIALGNPYGLAHTVTVGVLSARDREATYKGEVIFRDILQTDAAINQGSSGGPLLNAEGELIGVNVAILQQGQNIGFAVPVRRVRDLLADWLAPRTLKKAWLGFDPAERGGRLVATRLSPDGPAAKSGLRDGDRIRSLNQRPVSSVFEFNRGLLPYDADSEIELGIERERETKTVPLVLAALPKPDGSKLAMQLLGIEVADSGAAAARESAPYRRGVVVAGVREESPGRRAGLQAGLYLTRINNLEIHSVDDVGLALESVEPGETVLLIVAQFTEVDRFVIAHSAPIRLQTLSPLL